MDLVVQLGIVQEEFIREMTLLIATVSLFVTAWFLIGWMIHSTAIVRKYLSCLREHPVCTMICTVLAIPLIVYGATKVRVLIPANEQCDYRLGTWAEMIDDYVGYVRFTGDTFPTNVLLASCNGQVTNEVTFAENGQFYFETVIVPGVDLHQNRFWCRDTETNDWIEAVVDVYLPQEAYDINWVYGWSAALAHLPGNVDPKDYRYWFIGPRENLPEKIIEGGVEIIIDRMVRTAHGVHIEFHPDDSSLIGRVFTLQVRETVDSVLTDWKTIASTMTGVFDVPGNFVQEYNRLRIYCDREDAR